MAVKCRNKRCSKNRNGVCGAGYRNMEFDYDGRCMAADCEQAPYEECAYCKFNYTQCRASIVSKFCIDFEEENQ